jgi:hypothetical protein
MKIATVAIAALLCALIFTSAPEAAKRPAPLLPDIDQAPVGCPGGWKGDPMACTDWDVCMVTRADQPNPGCVTSGDIRAVRLRFTTTEDNVGDGPLLIYARRTGRGQKRMKVRQAFARADRSVPQSFERFQLRRLDGTTIAQDRKNGMCLGDRYTNREASTLPRAVKDTDTPLGRLHHELAFNTGSRASSYNCQRGRDPSSKLLELREGISVGQGDDYTYGIDYQWLDITRVPSGLYLVVNEANSRRALVEKRYDNNAASIVVSIQWPGGAADPPATVTAPPDVEMVASCPDSATCAPPDGGGTPAPGAARGRARVASGPALLCPLHDEL